MNDKGQFTIVAYGGGANSTAMLVKCVQLAVRVDKILFADTGGEKPHTYAYVEMFSGWLKKHGYPEVITVSKGGRQETLEESLLRLKTLPSIAYGGLKTCSQKFKIAPQDKFFNNLPEAQAIWRSGGKISKLIGYDLDERHRAVERGDDKYVLRYPLIEWGMDRNACIQTIKDAGLCPPGKSACFFCPNSSPSEIRALAATYPDLADRAIHMEANANLTKIKGLGRNFRWADVLKQGSLIDDDYPTPDIVCGCYDG